MIDAEPNDRDSMEWIAWWESLSEDEQSEVVRREMERVAAPSR